MGSQHSPSYPARSINLKGVIELMMIPNHNRPDKQQQKFIVRAINTLGFNPVDKPVHLYTLDELEKIGEMYREVVGSNGTS